MAKTTKRKTTPDVIEHVDDLADAGLQQKSVLGSNQPSIEVVDNIQQRADEFMAQNVVAWDMAEYYKKMSVQLLILKSQAISNLRNHVPATKELGECEEIMHTCLALANKHKYTYPSWKRELSFIDYHLVALAEINEMLAKKEWPTDAEGRPARLSTYLESILWF